MKLAIEKGISVQSFFPDKISSVIIKKMTPADARLALLWNWSIDSRNKQTSKGSLTKIMKSLGLEIKGNEVIDVIEKKSLGQIVKTKKEEVIGNWILKQIKESFKFPGFMGTFVQYACRTQTFTNVNCTTRIISDRMVAEVDGPKFYAHTYNRNATVAYAVDFSYIWFWESDNCDAYSFARIDDQTKSMTRAF